MSALVTVLKISFSNGPAIFFSLDAVYWADSKSAFLIKISDLSIRKQISDETAMLAYFKYFLSYLRLYLTKTKEAKAADINMVAYFIGGTSVWVVSIWSVFSGVVSVEGAFAECTYVDVGLSSIDFWLSIK